MKIKLQHGRIVKAAEMRKIERNTIWVVTCLSKNNREQFLGSYPSAAEAEQAVREEFRHRRQPLVVGYGAGYLGL